MTDVRVGHGLDAHRFGAGRPLWLGGIELADSEGLAGHSDGDVASHALADAVLGGAGLGDLGQHFPSTEARWEGMRSTLLLAEVASMARSRGLAVASAQVVIVAARPRLAGHTAAMARTLAAALGVEAARVAVSATSTDGMGFCGRGEGIAASAVVLLAPSASVS